MQAHWLPRLSPVSCVYRLMDRRVTYVWATVLPILGWTVLVIGVPCSIWLKWSGFSLCNSHVGASYVWWEVVCSGPCPHSSWWQEPGWARRSRMGLSAAGHPPKALPLHPRLLPTCRSQLQHCLRLPQPSLTLQQHIWFCEDFTPEDIFSPWNDLWLVYFIWGNCGGSSWEIQ